VQPFGGQLVGQPVRLGRFAGTIDPDQCDRARLPLGLHVYQR
jgi:hypothetical protein